VGTNNFHLHKYPNKVSRALLLSTIGKNNNNNNKSHHINATWCWNLRFEITGIRYIWNKNL